jgi:hypothetical protein
MARFVGIVPNAASVGWDARIRPLWTCVYVGVLLAAGLVFADVFGPWLVLELWESWTGMPLSLIP